MDSGELIQKIKDFQNMLPTYRQYDQEDQNACRQGVREIVSMLWGALPAKIRTLFDNLEWRYVSDKKNFDFRHSDSEYFQKECGADAFAVSLRLLYKNLWNDYLGTFGHQGFIYVKIPSVSMWGAGFVHDRDLLDALSETEKVWGSAFDFIRSIDFRRTREDRNEIKFKTKIPERM